MNYLLHLALITTYPILLVMVALFGILSTTISLFNGHRSGSYALKLGLPPSSISPDPNTSHLAHPLSPNSRLNTTNNIDRESLPNSFTAAPLSSRSLEARDIPCRAREIAVTLSLLLLLYLGEWRALITLMLTINIIVGVGDAVVYVRYCGVGRPTQNRWFVILVVVVIVRAL